MYKHSFKSYVKKSLYFIPVVALTVAVILLRHRLSHVLIPVVFAALFSVLLSPPVNYLTYKRNFKRSFASFLALLLLIIIVLLILTGILLPLIVSIKDAVANSEDLGMKAEEIFSGFGKRLQDFFRVKENSDAALWLTDALENIKEKLITSLSGIATGFLKKVGSASMELVTLLVDSVTTLVLTFYFLRDGKMINQRLMEFFPFDRRKSVENTISGLGKIFTDFLKGQLFVSLLLGILQTAGLFLLKVPYAPLLGFLAGLLNIIPYFGPFIGAVPAVIAAFFISPFRALMVGILFVVLQQVDNIILTPKIVEGQLEIHPVTTIIAVFLGGEFLGFFGILFGVPIYAAIRFILRKAFQEPMPLS